jgi:hypothetical protein
MASSNSKGKGSSSFAALAADSSLLDEKAKKLRPPAELPKCFDCIDHKNIVDLTTVANKTITDRKTSEQRGPYHVAMHIKVRGADSVEFDFDLETLSIDKLRALVKKLGIKGYCSVTEFRCRQLIGEDVVVYQQVYNSEIRETGAAAIKKKLSSELRKIQAFFHPNVFDQIMQINSLKDHSALENGTTANQTWAALADLYNNQDSSDANLDEIDSTSRFDRHNHLINNSGYEDIQLTQFTATMDNGNELKKYITGLFKLWREMKAPAPTITIQWPLSTMRRRI